MARSSNVRTGGPARIRLVVFDAEIPDGSNTDSIAQVLQNALRGPTVVQRVPAITNGAKTIVHEAAAESQTPDLFDETDDLVEAEAAAPTKPRAPRKPSPTPEPVPIDTDSDVSLASFAQGKDTKSQHKKYLVAAAWMKEHRGIDAITAGYIYTCFRTMGWSVGIPDFWQPLRDLKSQKFFTKDESGSYLINHLGLDRVRKLGDGAA
jgi:hypothetical protein